MDTLAWRPLRSECGTLIPAVVKENEHGFDSVRGRNLQIFVDPVDKAIPVRLPYQMMQKHSHHVEAQILGPAEFPVDGGQVEGLGLPHLKLIDAVARNEVTSRYPLLFIRRAGGDDSQQEDKCYSLHRWFILSGKR